VLDGEGVVQAGLFEEFFEVAHGRRCLTLTTTYGHRGAQRIRVVCLFVDVTIIIGRGHIFLEALLAPPLAAHGALLSVLDGGVRQCFSASIRCRAKLGHLVADGVLGGDVVPLLDGVLGCVGQCLERP
jgi:hypothetical protein